MAKCIVPLDELASPVSMKYFEARANSNGKGRSAAICFNHKGDSVKLIVQTPKLYCPFGVDEFAPDDGGPHKFSVRLTFRGMQNSEPQQRLRALLHEVDKSNIQYAYDNQATLWPKDGHKDLAIIEDRYTPLLKVDSRYDDQLRAKLNYTLDRANGGQRYEGMVFDDAKPPNEVDTGYIEAQSHIIALLEFGAMWIADKSFGQHIRAVQMKCFKNASLRAYSFDAKADEDDPME